MKEKPTNQLNLKTLLEHLGFDYSQQSKSQKTCVSRLQTEVREILQDVAKPHQPRQGAIFQAKDYLLLGALVVQILLLTILVLKS